MQKEVNTRPTRRRVVKNPVLAFFGCKRRAVIFVFNYSGRRLIGSLWDLDKLIPLTD
jgi:hypothetical protein